MVLAGAMLLDRLGPPGFRFRFIDFQAPRLPYLSPLARARALLARPWFARCYGVARQREGSRQNSIGGSGVLSLRHFGLVLYPLILGAWVPKNLPRRGWFRPGRCCSTGSGRLDLNLDLLISGPRDLLFYQPHACARALLAVVCPLLRGSSPTRGVAPKQHRGLGRAFTPAFRAGSLSLNPWRVGAEESAAARMVSAGAMLLDRLGPPGSEFRFIDFRAPRFALLSASRAREGAAGQAVVCP